MRSARAASPPTRPATSTRRSRPKGRSHGQPYAGDKDLVLIEVLADRHAALDARDRHGPARAGLRRRDRPGGRRRRHRLHERRPRRRHAGNTTDDVFVVKYDPAGNRSGCGSSVSPALADRGYALATDATGNDLRHRLHARRPGRRERRRQGHLPRQARPERRPALAAAVRERRRGQGLGHRRDRRRLRTRRDDVRRARQHARGRARRLGRPVRRRRQPGLAAAVRHDGQRGGLGPDGGCRRQHLRRRVLRGRLRRSAGGRQGHRRCAVRPEPAR